jgi:dipeptidyl aminopeptidase/acylaminoacyl peptidase
MKPRLYLLPVMLAVVSCALASGAPFTIDQVLGSAFPTHLTAAAAGGKLAWVSNARGVINVMVAEPPAYTARALTHYRVDNGQDITEIQWLPDATALVYVRGEEPNRAGEIPNPALDPRGASQVIWLAALDGSAPRKIAGGNSVAISPRGHRIAYIRKDQLFLADLTGTDSPEEIVATRGKSETPVWSLDGNRLAFVSNRDDHSFIGVLNPTAHTLLYLDPSSDFDSEPAWAPDSRRVAFLREPSHGKGRIYGPRRSDEPWSIRIADAGAGLGREIWKADGGPGSVFREVEAESQIFWATGDRLVFPWEADGWTHLYSIPAAGGKPLLLTPGEFEVENVALAPGGGDIIFNSNQNDADRRHIWRVAANGAAPVALTTGQGIEWSPVMTSDGHLAVLCSDARRPADVAIVQGTEPRHLDPSAIPPDFPLRDLVVPQPVTFPSADGLTIHGQLFLPPQRVAARAPALVFLHGGPRRQMLLGWNDRSYYHNAYALNQYFANRGYVVLSVNFRSGIGYGLNFREALDYGASGASDFQDVEAAGRYLISRTDVNPERIGVWGGSYGGFLTALALARDSSLFRAGVDLHGVHDWSTEYDLQPGDPFAKTAFASSPLAFVEGWRSPVLLIHGDDDRNVKFNQTVVLADALRRRRVSIEELIFPDEVHEFLLYRHWREAYEAADRFFGKYLLR